MPILNSGSTTTVTLGAYDSITLQNRSGQAASISVGGTVVNGNHSGSRTYGPYPSGGSVSLNAISGDLYYEVADGAGDTKRVFTRGSALLAEDGSTVSAGGGTLADTLTRLYETEATATGANAGASFLDARTVTADETPVITAAAAAPSADATDPAAKRVVLCGAASAYGNVEQDLTTDERAYLPRWIAGYNQGLRARWRYVCYTLAQVPASTLGDAGSGNAGNNVTPAFKIANTVCYSDFVLDGDVLYFQAGGTGFSYAIWVNDKLVTVAAGTGITLRNGGNVFTSTTTNHYIKIKFPSVNRRRIRLANIAAGGLSDLHVRSTHTVRPLFDSRLTWLHFGDSFGSSTAGGDAQVLPLFGSGQQLAARFGRGIDFVDAHLGGSGFGVATAGTPNFLQRLEIDFNRVQPAQVISIAAAQNDTPTTIADNAPAVFAGLRRLHPKAPIFVAPTYAPASYATIADKIAALRAAAAGTPGVYVFDSYPARVQDRIVNGSGREGALAGDGTADRLVSSDNIHPSFPAGHREWGSWIADQIYSQCLRGLVQL